MGLYRQKNQLRTVRFTSHEAQEVELYLKQNPIFDGFSALARVATLTFIGESKHLVLKPAASKKRSKLFWDYDLTDVQVREILSEQGLSPAKRWVIERILSQARFDEVFQYLDLETIRKYFTKLRLPERKKRHWSYALARWASHG